MAELSVEIERSEASCVLVRLVGELDKLSAPQLSRRFDELVAEGYDTVVVDAERLTFCDSSGLWALIQLQRNLRARGGMFRLIQVQGVLRRVLDVTGLSAAFPA
ncbi:STAS domain-containing protein [Nonomuraea sp. NPDC050556]|uniref:STAS domain-containing protein n=1 Tax=Nonomuraea sp. NPDC050556 TaxID=3364369 RepID=UPI0037AAFB9E